MPVASAAEQATQRLADRLVATGTLPRRDWHDAAATVLAAGVACAWLLMGVLGVATFVWAHPIWWLLGAALIAGAVMLRPRPVRIGPNATLDDARAPVRSTALDGALAALAGEVGCRPPEVVFVTTAPDVTLLRDSLGRRRVLMVGMPLWVLLDDGARRAALVHELGHEAFRDPRRVGAVSLASRWLAQWSTQIGAGVEGASVLPDDQSVLLDPLAHRTLVAGRVWGLPRYASNVADAGLGAAVRWVNRLLVRATFVPHQRAELLADDAAVRIAGSRALLRLLDAEPLRHRAALSARQALVRSDGVDLAHTVVEHLAALPGHQREGLEVIVANEEVRTDQAHPPVRVRRAMAHRLDRPAPVEVVDRASWREACADLDAAFVPLERRLRELAARDDPSRPFRRQSRRT